MVKGLKPHRVRLRRSRASDCGRARENRASVVFPASRGMKKKPRARMDARRLDVARDDDDDARPSSSAVERCECLVSPRVVVVVGRVVVIIVDVVVRRQRAMSRVSPRSFFARATRPSPRRTTNAT